MASGTKQIITLITLVVVLVIGAVAFIVFRPHAHLGQAVAINTATAPSLGNTYAKTQIVAFEDLKCGNCQIYNKTLFPQIEADFIKPGKAKYSVILLAFIPGSTPAANAAYCLYDQNPQYFFPFVKYVYDHQLAEDQDWATTSRLLQYAGAAVPAADQNKLSECMISGKFNSKINDNLTLAGKIMQPVATPTIYINGHKLKKLSMKGVRNLISQTT